MKNVSILSAALVPALFAALFVSGLALTHTAQTEAVQAVTISAKRMSEAEKIAYDTATQTTQIVIVSAKRLTAEEKLALDQLEENAHKNLVQKNQRPTAG